MPNQAGTIERIALELSRALEQVSGLIKPDIVSELGFRLPDSIFQNPALVQAFTAASTHVNELPALSSTLNNAIAAENIPQIIATGIQLTQKLTLVFQSLDQVAAVFINLAGSLPATEQAAVISFANSFPRRLLDYTVITYLESKNRLAVHGLALLGLLEWKREGVDPATSASVEHIRKEIRFDRVSQLLSDPKGLLLDKYEWGSATFETAELFETVKNLIEDGIRGTADIVQIDDEEVSLEALLFALQRNVAVNPPGLNVEFRGLLGNELNLTEEVTLAFPWLQKLSFKVQAAGNLLATVTPPLDVEFANPGGNVSLEVSGDLSTQQATEPFTLLALTGASRIEARTFGITAGLRAEADSLSATVAASPSLGLHLEDARLNLDLGQSDSFIKQTVSRNDISSTFNLSATWSMDQGLVLQGSGGLEINLPSHADLGIAKLTNLFFKVTLDDDVKLETSAGFTTKLGPLTATVSRIGLVTQLAFVADNSGNLGPVDLSFDFKPPTGVGLSVDGGGFKGGGFLEFEPEEGRYSGMLELEFQDQFTVKAIGLLNTRLPNGQSGFSLLIVISSEFTPIQLGLGFKLNGIGGVLGLNRTINVEPLRTGLRENRLNSILFPTDIIANADRIISDLRQIFPPQEGQFIFGPMARITWGTPTLVTVDLGLMLEVPEPVRLVIVGVLRAVLPDEAAALLRVQVNFLGEINFERRQLSFDASLFESKLLGFTLSGDMALRLDWGADANFLVTVGGFHPAFEPPAMNLPALRRLSLSLLEGDNPRLKLELYLAVTSNTAQFGAKLELYAAAWKFNVYGFLSFDVLFQFNPFYFVAEITAMLSLRVGSASIASLKLTLTLEGPTPWKAQGSAQFKICWFFTLKVRFNKTFGEARNTTLPDVALLPLLAAALRADDNWEGELPAGRHRLESVREVVGGELVVHPVGTLKISQKVVPLQVRIDRVGSQRPSDGREFQITEVSPAANEAVVEEAFAPAQYFDLTDEEKLASASFKQFASGVRVGNEQELQTGYAGAREVSYELKYKDRAGEQQQYVVDELSFQTWTRNGAIAQSELSFARQRKSRLAPEAVAVGQESFAIVNTGNLQLFDELSVLGNERAASARLKELLETNPRLRGQLQVVPAFELAA